MSATTPSEILYGAADRIAEFGHHKGDHMGPGDFHTAPVCAHMALNAATVRLTGRAAMPELEMARTALRAYLAPEIVTIWNDAPERTAEEVIATLRAAAVIEAAKEAEATTQPTVGVGAGSA